MESCSLLVSPALQVRKNGGGGRRIVATSQPACATESDFVLREGGRKRGRRESGAGREGKRVGKCLDSLTYCQCSILVKQHGSKKIACFT